MLTAIRKRLSAVPPARRKSWGEWCMLASALCIVPLLVMHDLSAGVKVVLQLLWVIILAAGFWLAGSVKSADKSVSVNTGCQGNMQGDGAVPLPRAVCSFLALLRYASDGRCGERWGWVQAGFC